MELFLYPAFFVAFLFWYSIHIVPEYERVVVLTLGRYSGTKGPGLVIIIPGIQRALRVDLRVVTLDVPSQDVMTKDNVSVTVNAVVYFRVLKPDDAVLKIENYRVATSQIAQTTLRSVVGQFQLDELLSGRDKINQELQSIIDEQTDPWGIKVTTVEIKDVELPDKMKRIMGQQAEAERERRAKITRAEGEAQAAEKLSEAARILAENPVSVQLRYMQTLVEVAAENNSTTIFPVPVDMLRGLSLFNDKLMREAEKDQKS